MWDWIGSIYMKLKDTIYSGSELIPASIGSFFIYSVVTNGEISAIMSNLAMKSAEILNEYSINLTVESNMNSVIIAGLSPGTVMINAINQRCRENMGLKKERGRWDIIEDILIVLTDEKKSKKTRIMQRSYLDWRNFQRYFDFLLEAGFIAKYNGPIGEGYYEMTEKGNELLKRLRNVKDILH